MKRLIVVMGVSGCGKSTIGRALATAREWPFLEGDDYHPASNIEKMSRGIPLTDIDRGPWLDAIDQAIQNTEATSIVLACSALTTFVQERLKTFAGIHIKWIWLTADPALIRKRMIAREHFAPPSLLESQIDALMPPAEATEFRCEKPVADILDAILASLPD